MNIEIGLVILLILILTTCFFQRKTERFVSGTTYANFKTDTDKMNTINSFFQRLTFTDDKYYLDGVEINCNVNGTNNTDEDTVV